MQQERFENQIRGIIARPVPDSLASKIMEAVSRAEIKRARNRLAAYRAVFVLACAATIGSLLLLRTEALQSGFGALVKLIFSDGDILVRQWRTYFWSVLETLPALALACTLASLGVLIWIGQTLARIRSYMGRSAMKHANSH